MRRVLVGACNSDQAIGNKENNRHLGCTSASMVHVQHDNKINWSSKMVLATA